MLSVVASTLYTCRYVLTDDATFHVRHATPFVSAGMAIGFDMIQLPNVSYWASMYRFC